MCLHEPVFKVLVFLSRVRATYFSLQSNLRCVCLFFSFWSCSCNYISCISFSFFFFSTGEKCRRISIAFPSIFALLSGLCEKV